jgi:sec-independent protein translocase protein TatB
MFDIGYSELLLIAVVALVVIGPKDLPRVMRTVGHWTGRARGMARHFRSGVDTMMREAELEEMEKKWREENERILRDHPFADPLIDPMALDSPAEPPEGQPESPLAPAAGPASDSADPSAGFAGPPPRSGEEFK